VKNEQIIQGLAIDLKAVYQDLDEIKNLELEPIKDGKALGIIGDPFEKKLKDLLTKVQVLREKYADSPIKISGFSITIGAVLINSSAAINFKLE